MNSKNSIESYFVSDIHLKSVQERNAIIFLSFLRQLKHQSKKRPVELFLLGDIFDLWISDHHVFVNRFEAILFEMKDLVAHGVPIYYFEGNHDVHLDVYFEKEIRAEVFVKAHFFERDGHTLRIEHGDYINPDDKVYHKYLQIIRNPWIEQIGHTIPGGIWDSLGQAASRWSRKKGMNRRKRTARKGFSPMLIDYTKKVYEHRDFDVLITGHIHERIDETLTVNGKRVRTINLGSWYDEPQVLLLKKGHWSWRPAQAIELEPHENELRLEK